MKVSAIKKIEIRARAPLPLFLVRVAAGFPSPADDFLDQSLDLNEFIIKNPSATFCVKAAGDSMERAGIFEGDVIVIDRSKQPVHNSIILAVVNGEFTLKRLLLSNTGQITLSPENPKYKAIEIIDGTEFEIWGVATTVVHPL